jgi:hypothetical protein
VLVRYGRGPNGLIAVNLARQCSRPILSLTHAAKVTEAASEHRPFRQSDHRSFHRSDHRLRVRRSHAELEPVQTASCPQEALAVGNYSMSAKWRSGADRKLWRLEAASPLARLSHNVLDMTQMPL